MPHYSLNVTAELEGASSVAPTGSTSSGGAFQWRIKFACGSCREVSTVFSVFSPEDSVPLPNGRGEANLVQKCKFCNEAWSVDVTPIKNAALTADVSTAVKLAEFEVRGCVPVSWNAGDGWTVRGTSDEAIFEAIDFTEGDVSEYDEGAEAVVEVRKIEGVFVLGKAAK